VSAFPISSGATAHAYDFARQQAPPAADVAGVEPSALERGQQALFANPNPERVIAFESLTSPLERQSIRARAADLGRTSDARPDPLKQQKVELPRPRGKKKPIFSQQNFELFGSDELTAAPQSHIICDAPVAPPMLRIEAALIDGALMLCPIVAGLAFFFWEGGRLPFDKHLAPFWLAALLTVPILYKAMWTCANRDTIGMSCTGLRLVDFDGNPPSLERRYQRLFGSFISVLAAGIGLVWALVDEDALAWHDHISNTFPTIDSEN
jgi:uncharacterized RDD family membrane protein YckC